MAQQAYSAEDAIRDPAFRSRVTDDRTRARADLTDIGFATAGSIYNSKNDPNVSQAWRQAGANISGVLQERWFRKEFEGFSDQYLMPYVERLRNLDGSLVERFGTLDTMGQVMQPDGTAVKLDPNSPESEQLKKQWLAANVQELARATDDLMNAAMKYGNGNPLIDQRLNQIMASHSEVIGQITNPAQFMQGQQSQADLEKTRSEAGKIQGEEVEARAHAGYWNRMPNDGSGSGSSQEQMFMSNPQYYRDKLGARATVSLLASGKDPWSEPYRIKVENEHRSAIVQKAVEEHSKGNAKYGNKVGVDANGNIVEPDKMDQQLKAKGDVIWKKGVINSIDAIFPNDPGMEDEIRRHPQFSQYLPKEGEKPQEEKREVTVPKVLTRSEAKTKRKEFEQVGYQAIDDAFRKGKAKNEEEAAQIALQAIDEYVTADEENPQAVEQATKLAQEALGNVTANWTKYSEVGRGVVGKPSLGERIEGILSEGMESARKAAPKSSKTGLGL